MFHVRAAKAEFLDSGISDWVSKYSDDVKSGSYGEQSDGGKETEMQTGASSGADRRLAGPWKSSPEPCRTRTDGEANTAKRVSTLTTRSTPCFLRGKTAPFRREPP